MFIKLLENQTVQHYINKCLSNNWIGTPWEQYPLLGAKQKGGMGELLVEMMLKDHGNNVESPTNPGHDRRVNKKKIEIKFSLANSNSKKDGRLIDPDSFTFNHIGLEKDWEILLLVGVNPDEDNPNIRQSDHTGWTSTRVFYVHKKDLVKHMQSQSPVLKRQQGGKKGSNDDYILAGRNGFLNFVKLPFVNEYKGGKL